MNSMYKPKKCNQVVFRADDDLVAMLRFIADYYGVSKSMVITELVECKYLALLSTVNRID